VRRSSTSSSERLPWAGIWAVIVVIAIDVLLFSSWGPWEALYPHVSVDDLLANGIARDRVQLQALAAVPEGKARVVVVGSSRAQVGYRFEFAEEVARGPLPFHVARLVHAGMNIFAIRSLADELVGYRPDVVVLLLSEFDTHRPLEPRAVAGAKLGLEARAQFYRLALATLLDAYRYRRVVEWAGARTLRIFPMGEQGGPQVRTSSQSVFPYTAGEPSTLDARRARQLGEEIERRFSGKTRTSVLWETQRVRTITRGDHAEIQMRLVRGAVERLRAAGAEVIIVEGALSPLAAEYYDPTIRDDFVAFARGLARESGARFVPLKVSATYREEEFADLSHLNPEGSRKLTGVILQAVYEVLEERS